MSYVETPQTVSLFRGWLLRISLLVAAICGFLGALNSTLDHLDFSVHGVPATIYRAKVSQKIPSDGWLNNKNNFYVKVVTSDGKEDFRSLFLSRQVIETLVDGRQAEIIYVQDNPRRHLIKGEPLPPFGIEWLAFGTVFLIVFVYSLKLK